MIARLSFGSAQLAGITREPRHVLRAIRAEQSPDQRTVSRRLAMNLNFSFEFYLILFDFLKFLQTPH